MKPRTRLHAAILFVLVSCLVGCIDVQSTVTVNHDGSGTIEETTLLSAQLTAMMSMASSQAQSQAGGGGMTMSGGPNVIMSRDGAEAKAKQMGAGVTLKSLEDLKMPDGRQGQKVVYAFTNLGQVRYDTGDMKNASPSPTAGSISFTFDNGTVTVTMKKAAPAAGATATPPAATGTPDAANPLAGMPQDQMLAMMKPMLAGMRVALRIKAASGIASTDATYVDGDTVTFVDVQFDKLFDNPALMAKLGSMSDTSSLSAADASAMLKGIPGVQAETKETIVIKLR